MSLQDQLMKAGLVDKKKLQNAKKEKHKNRKQQGKKPGQDEAEALLRSQQAKAEKAERDRALNREKQALAERNAIAAQVRQLIESNRLRDSDGETAYNFSDGRQIKRIYIKDELVTPLSRGQLAIVRFGEGYALVPAKVAEKISQRDSQSVVVLNEPEVAPDEDDPYAEYQIPDDLMW
ncbi:DUF2058 domain-containing protein [Motiliproteus sp. SC1-56]|uniref:DUF2058 domain-containing protein n=1 Tax=Motiliproteus sp. SC1-56 TaxID=2799565 RepID=UPI001A8C2A03|nr:DUF2058 domain-containing protein [Motiliproteus sp. SC1-56]